VKHSWPPLRSPAGKRKSGVKLEGALNKRIAGLEGPVVHKPGFGASADEPRPLHSAHLRQATGVQYRRTS